MGGASVFVLGQRGADRMAQGGGQKTRTGASLSKVNPPPQYRSEAYPEHPF